MYAAVAHVHAIEDGISKRSAALDDPTAHAPDIASAIADARSDQRRSPDAGQPVAIRRPMRPGGSAGYASSRHPAIRNPGNSITAVDCSGGNHREDAADESSFLPRRIQFSFIDRCCIYLLRGRRNCFQGTECL